MKMKIWTILLIYSVSAVMILSARALVEAKESNRQLSRNDMFVMFDTLDRKLTRGEGYSRHTNEAGTLAWAQSYLMEAYLDMYEATRDDKYLKSFVRQGNRVIAHTDQALGVRDYKERSVVGWSATRYSHSGKRVVWLVHSGMITYPLARFAFIVNRNKLTAYRAQADSYVSVAKASLGVFDKNWMPDAVTGGGYYQFDSDEPHGTNAPDRSMPVPLNQQLAAGRTMIMLYEITGDRFYRQRAEALARHFKGNLKGRGPYVWTYWHGKGLNRSKGIEDISHGAIDIDFAVQAHRSGMGFDTGDMARFRATYEKNIRRNGSFAGKVDGTGGAQYKEAIGRWLELSEFTCAPWKDFHGMLERDELSNHPQVMLGIAKLIKYYDRCKSQ